MGLFNSEKRIKKAIAACMSDAACAAVLSSMMEVAGGYIPAKEEAPLLEKLVEGGIAVHENDLFYLTMEAREELSRSMTLHYQCPGLRYSGGKR